MENVLSILENAATEKRESSRQQWAKYRAVLQASIAGKLSKLQSASLVDLVAALGLSPDQVSEHVKALQEKAARDAKRTRLEKVTAELEPLSRKLEAWSTRRAEALAKLDAEGAPLQREAGAIEGERASLESFLIAGEGRLEGRYPELFGIDTTPPAPVLKSAAQRHAESRWSALHSDFSAVRAALMAGTVDRRKWPDDLNETITETFLIAAAAGYPEFAAENFPEGVQHDPRRAEFSRLSRKVAKGYDTRDLDDQQRNLLAFGERIGWTAGAVETEIEAVV